jgi:predicted nucleic acid-binding protein
VIDKVVDASALAAIVFDEPSRAAMEQQLKGVGLVAPSLLEYEIASVCLKKMQARPEETEALLDALEAFALLPITYVDVDFPAAIALSQKTRITLYDACYLHLARQLGLGLVTLDARLAKAVAIV